MMEIILPELDEMILSYVYDAASYGWTYILKYSDDALLLYCKIQSTSAPDAAVFDTALAQGNRCALDMLLKAYGRDYFLKARVRGNISTLQWYIEHIGLLPMSERLLIDCFGYGLDTVKWLCEDQGIQPNGAVGSHAVEWAKLDIVKYLIGERKCGIDDPYAAFTSCVRDGDLGCAELVYNSCKVPKSALLHAAYDIYLDASLFNWLFYNTALPPNDRILDKYLWINGIE